jgi:Carboxypeptidase regulatory-like domain
VNSAKNYGWERASGGNAWRSMHVAGRLAWLGRMGLWVLLCYFPARALAQSPQPSAGPGGHSGVPDAQATAASTGLPNQQSLGNVSGLIVDQSEGTVAGAQVRLTREDQSPSEEVLSDDDGRFSFANVAPGAFRLTIASEGFSTQVFSGTVAPGQDYIVPQVVLAVAAQVTQVTVGLTRVEMAEVQIKDQEKQRVLGIIPNFYVSYVPDAVALTSKQKFELAWRSSVDPFTFVAVGVIAGGQQAGNELRGYGQGAQGYGRRYGASYGDVVIGTFMGSAIMPSLLKQDPRYFYKGTGSNRSRFFYALASPFLCKGDNGRWQPNYSDVVGNFAAAGIANSYYPTSDRGAGYVAETALIRLGESAVASVFQEFIARRLTPKVSNRAKTQH